MTVNFNDSLAWSRYPWTLVRWTRVSGVPLDDDDSEELARLLSVHAVEHRLNGAPQLLEAWFRVHAGGASYTNLEQEAIRAFLGPLGPTAPVDHRQSSVAEYLWHVLSTVDDSEPQLVRIHGPKFYATAPGGDGLTIRRDGDLVVTLWEIKKHTGSHLTNTIRDAYAQLSSGAPRYLAEQAAVSQITPDPEEARVMARLVESWLAGESHMQAGVAVVTDRSLHRCFSTMRRYFTHLQSGDPCQGLSASIEDYPQFAERVCEIAWTGL